MELPNPQHETFCHHVALGLSYTQAAIRSGYAESAAANQGSRMVQRPEIAARVEELRSSRTTMATSNGIRSSVSRVSALEDRWLRMRRIVLERAEDPDLDEVPGGKTGLLIKQVKQIGTGDKAQVVTSYVLDRDLLSELRAHEEQAAEELGQRAKRIESYSQSMKATGSIAELRAEIKAKAEALPPEIRAELEAPPIDVEQAG